jgi:hypothetical protein
MGEIEHVGDSARIERRRAGDLAVNEPGFAGRPVRYSGKSFSSERAWRRLSGMTRDWAERCAGEPIKDPHTHAPTVYWYCRIDPRGSDGPSQPVGATYDLVMFGKRGLAVSEGTTEHLVDEPDATRWRHRRFDVPIDPSQVRHDHRSAAPPNLDHPDGTAASGPPASVTSEALLPPSVAGDFGNLPLATQRFLLEPFLTSGKRPSEALVHALLERKFGELRETYWTYLFNARWAGFAYTTRSVPTATTTGPLQETPERPQLQRTPWAVSVWVAPVMRSA